MKKPICLAVSMLVLTGLAAPAAEQSPPAVVSVPSEMKRVVLVRLKYNTNLLEGLRQVVKDERIHERCDPERRRVGHPLSSPRREQHDASGETGL